MKSLEFTVLIKKIVMDKKPGRNDPCPCGSGKKYKNCCLANEAKKTYTESGKRKFKATVLQTGKDKSETIFQGTTPAPAMPRDIKPLDLSKFKQTKKDYRAKPTDENLPFKIEQGKEEPSQEQTEKELPPEEYKKTDEDFRQ